MRALLLAAGLGTRLKPLTNYLPKCLVPIRGRPLIDYWLQLLVENNVDEILINTHYLEPLVIKFIAGSSWIKNVTIVHEKRLLGTGGTILANKGFFEGAPFLVAHADNLTSFDLLAFIESHSIRPCESEMTMMIFETPDPKSSGIVEINARGIVTSFHEKVPCPLGNLANAAVYILEPTVLDYMVALGKSEIDFSIEVIPQFMGRISTFFNSSYHRDIGTVESWLEAQKDFSCIPASQINANSWVETLKSTDASLQTTMTQLQQTFLATNLDKR